MFTNFNDVVDNLRIIKQFDNGSKNNKIYKCTITSRTCRRTCEQFREDLYKYIRANIEGIMEYHSKSVKIHMHGYIEYDLKDTDVSLLKHRGSDILINYEDFTVTFHEVGISETWNKYCRKQIEYTYEYNDFVKKGLWFRFHKYGKQTKSVWEYEYKDIEPGYVDHDEK